MEKLKHIFLKNLKEIARILEYSTDKTSELALLLTLYLFGEKSIHSSLLTPQRKQQLYKTLAELKEGTDLEGVYRFFQRTVLEWVKPILTKYKGLSLTTRRYRKVFILSIDDTSLKVFGQKMEGAKKLHDGKGYFVGYHIVFIGLCLGNSFRIPLAFRIYRPETGVTRPQLAAEMLEEILPSLPVTPQIICFDSAYCTGELNRVIRKHNLNWVSKSKSNRKYALFAEDYEKVTGQLCLFKDMYYRCMFSAKVIVEKLRALGITVIRVYQIKLGRLIFTYDRKDRILLSSDERVKPRWVSLFYQLRWTLEEIFRVMKQHLSFTRLYQKTLVGQALAHGVKMLAMICLQWLRYESRKLQNMTYRQTQDTLKHLFQSSSKYGQSPYAELMKYKLV